MDKEFLCIFPGEGWRTNGQSIPSFQTFHRYKVDLNPASKPQPENKLNLLKSLTQKMNLLVPLNWNVSKDFHLYL